MILRILLTTLLIPTFLFAQTPGESQEKKVMRERLEKNAEFADPNESPLEKEDIPGFKALNYYPYKPEYCVNALLVVNPEPKVFKMKTTTERRPEYRTYGELRAKAAATVYCCQTRGFRPPRAMPTAAAVWRRWRCVRRIPLIGSLLIGSRGRALDRVLAA